MGLLMASVVLSSKDKKRFDCHKCMTDDADNWLAQGRTEEYVQGRIRRKLKAKGCLDDSKTEVFRLNNGDRIYRCPRSLCNNTDSISHFSQYDFMSQGGITFDGDSKPWKWHQVVRRVRNEVLSVQRLAIKNNAPK